MRIIGIWGILLTSCFVSAACAYPIPCYESSLITVESTPDVGEETCLMNTVTDDGERREAVQTSYEIDGLVRNLSGNDAAAVDYSFGSSAICRGTSVCS